METLKQKAIQVISKLPDTVNIDDIMYKLYVVDKIRKGIEDVKQGRTIGVKELKQEITI
ncbi:hypothetical protein KKC83_05070 [Patescibacteria group bacterium]|nr:hypothetical protein [Patescibacteria group bacterium]MCG2697892.1 hypothetical protein [Candidatus Parcubacteria bacterium]MBU4015711.1 hypothetical protein [Patescibacteria group bacterium]MBU4026889.1 hypothetical protein [Patescibacteria group bacterium]MBU4073453.1 hypothetical protein [Patescibacteria group bacterium]